MITIEEISVENIDEFWNLHYKYLIEDEIITDEEDKEYFKGSEYRETIKSFMLSEKNKLHMIYFLLDDIKIGLAQYKTYQTEDGKCFILDYWILEEFRNNGLGHKCFNALEKYTKKDGATYYEINCEKENSIKFWKSLGFIENGHDEWNVKLFIKL